jgi:TetR/AcrR family transcriptional regulator, transcriptional repressor of aconitase
MRLIEAAETLFIRKGFDDTSVDEITGMAGYSRGAFYSNFEDKDQVFLAVIDRCWFSVPKALETIVQQVSDPASLAAAVRDWYSNHWRVKESMALQIEFSRRAMKQRSVRKRLAELRREELANIAGYVTHWFGTTDRAPAERPEVIALVLLAAARGLAILATHDDPAQEQIYTEAAALVFDRITAPGIPQ